MDLRPQRLGRRSGRAAPRRLPVGRHRGDVHVPPRPCGQRYLPALAELFPEAGRAGVERFLVVREHAATFRATPGTAGRRAGARSLLPGLALAGSYTDTGWPATMEGAVRSGRAAAEAVLPAFARSPLAVAA